MMVPFRIRLVEKPYFFLCKTVAPLDILPTIEQKIFAKGVLPEELCWEAEVARIGEEVLFTWRKESVRKLRNLRVPELHSTQFHPAHEGGDFEGGIPGGKT